MTPLGKRRRVRAKSFWRDEDGAYQVEYLVVLMLVGLVTAIAISNVAVPLVLYHQSVREAVTSPVP